MKKFILALVFCLSGTLWASDYNINVHVTRSRVRNSAVRLDVVIDGKKYELESNGSFVLSVGDYKARLVKDWHRGGYDAYQIYEFQFPDQKTRKFFLTGTSE